MNNYQEKKTSHKEREALKKKLQKLFRKQEKESNKICKNQTVHNEETSGIQTTTTVSPKNQKEILKPQQHSIDNKSEKKQDLQQKEKKTNKPAANKSFKLNSKNKISQKDNSSNNNSTRQHKQQNKGNNNLEKEPQPQQKGFSKASTVELKNNSKANKNTEKSKKFFQEEKVLQQTNPQAQKYKKKKGKKNQNKAEISAKSKSPTTNVSVSSKTHPNARTTKGKRTSEDSKEHIVINKKQKLNKEQSNKYYDSSSDEENSYDIKNMIGLVRGGDYDGSEVDDMEDEYWKNKCNNDEDSSSSENSNKVELIEHTLPYSDEDDEEEEEEEEEGFSDYYEEESSYDDYSMNSEEVSYSSDYDTTYDFNDDEHDNDYYLPKHIPEDLIIHRGTATKRDIKPEDNVSFNSDSEDAQIIELQEQETVKVIKQPNAYDKEELTKLKYSEKTITFQSNVTETAATDATNDTNECPKLVHITDEDGFQLYYPDNEEEDKYEENEELEDEDYRDENESLDENEYYDNMDDESLGSEYTELNSDDGCSLLSEDINDKYLNLEDDSGESADEINENVWNRKHKADIIDATNCKYIDETEENITEAPEGSLNDNINQLPSVKLYKNVDLKSLSSILSTTIIDQISQNETLKSHKTNDHSLSSNELTEHSNESVDIENTEGSLVEESAFETSKINSIKPGNAQSLVNYKTKFYNAFDSNLVIVLLKDPFYVYGTVRLTLVAGHVEVYGHTLSVDKEVEIFSPRGCSVIEIASTPKSKISDNINLKDILKNYENNFALADLKAICDLYDCEHDAVILLKRNETRKKIVQQFKKFMNENVFPNINNISMERPLYNTEYILRCMINTSNQEQKCLQIPQQWQELKITSQSRIMVTGGKSVGKSTLLRYLINRYLPQQILLIDLDIGQPEVFIPQTVSCTVVKQPLLGPGFMLNLEPDISFAVGHTNIALCAHKYIQAVRNLIAGCMKEEKYRELPWLINTMGYNKGFGLELISVIVKEFANLTDIIQLQSSKEINNFDAVLWPHVIKSVPRNMFVTEEDSERTNLEDVKDYYLHVWQSAVQQESRYLKEWEMSAKDLRFAMLLTRLSKALQGHAEWLTDCKPLSANLDELKIVNLMDNSPLATTEELSKSLEANLVYLCHYQQDNEPLKCLGIGVVRAIDFHVHQVYLLPAIPHSLLKYVNCLALGEMCLPTSIFTNQGPRIKKTAAFVYNTIEDNASKAIKQIYHRPRRFLTGKHKSLD